MPKQTFRLTYPLSIRIIRISAPSRRFMINSNSSNESKPLSVSGLNLSAKNLLESNFPHIWIEGEVSNLSQPSSGHIYFSLKDEKSQISCAFFRQYQKQLATLENGQQVQLRAKLTLYPQRGSYQLLVYDVQDAGTGALEQAFKALKLRLEKEGLFDEKHKKSLPIYPSVIGVITSSTGAALKDVLSVLERRYPIAQIEVYNAFVQGDAAAPSLIRALEFAISRNTSDVLILCRGGGSIEDLWPFNDEQLARTIFKCPIPIVSGVGHEIDFTISDWVSDLRAPTPSAAAEAATSEKNEMMQLLDTYQRQLHLLVINKISNRQNRLSTLAGQLTHPREKIALLEGKIKQLAMQINQRINHQIDSHHLVCERLFTRLSNAIKRLSDTLPALVNNQKESLKRGAIQLVERHQQKLKHLACQLDSLSPLRTLERGYVITKDLNGRIVTSANQVTPKMPVKLRWADGEKTAVINETE